MAIMDNFTMVVRIILAIAFPADQVHSPTRQNRNGAVASAVPSALTRGPAHFDWQLAGATRSGTAGGEARIAIQK
jgi:hypothetical protein